jgi:diguanylate cyclase (GGDEF)-like protein
MFPLSKALLVTGVAAVSALAAASVGAQAQVPQTPTVPEVSLPAIQPAMPGVGGGGAGGGAGGQQQGGSGAPDQASAGSKPGFNASSGAPQEVPSSVASPSTRHAAPGFRESDGTVSDAKADGAGPVSVERNAPARSTDVPLVGSVSNEVFWGLIGALAVAAIFAAAWLFERGRARRARRLALQDAVTGLPNRAAFDHQFAIDWHRFSRHGHPLGVVVVDLDRFKEINDEQGHAAGDRTLAQAAELISSRVRKSDLAARIGGDEFGVLTTETDSGGLEALAEDLQALMSEAGIRASVGWAEANDESDADQAALLHRADLAMYARKRSSAGRARKQAKDEGRPTGTAGAAPAGVGAG